MLTGRILAVCILAAAALSAQVIVSEIMYNPASSEALPNDVEWLEIYNSGPTAVDVSGWFVQDEDGTSGGLAGGTVLQPFEAAVVVPDVMTVSEFQAAWGAGFQILPLPGWSNLLGLSNSPSATNEILTLRNAGSAVMDEVNYDDAAPWPTDPGGPSIYLLDGALDPLSNDSGASWALSTLGVDGAVNNLTTSSFNGMDTGSPGTVVDSSATAPFVLDVTQLAPHTDITFAITGAQPGARLFNLVALECTAPPGSGPFFGLAISPAAGAVFTQLALPPGTEPFHVFASAAGTYTFTILVGGAGAGIALQIEAVSIELLGGVISRVSPTTGCVSIAF